MAIGNILSAGAGVLSGVFSGIGAGKRQDKALQAQKQENEKNREFAKEQARLANKFNEYMYDKNNLYNSPEQQMARLKAAGLNPDMMYAQGASGLTNTSVQGAAQGASPVGYDPATAIMNTPTMGESIIQGLSAAKVLAETKNINADTSKKEGDITSINLDNIRKAATNGSMIELADMQVNLSKSTLQLNDKQLDILSQELQNLQTTNSQLNADIQEKMSRIAQNESSTLLNRINAMLASPRFENECKDLSARLREVDSRINLNKQQVERMVIMTMAEKMNVDADTLLKNAGYHNITAKTETEYYNQDVVKLEGKMLKFDLGQKIDWDSTERGMKITNETLHSVSHIVDAVGGALPGFGPAMKGAAKAANRVRGFSR